jgi:hypothetical protein
MLDDLEFDELMDLLEKVAQMPADDLDLPLDPGDFPHA